ncbi:ATP-binding cassette domain-containing protein [Plantactinospora sp. S1510]|uniref:ATP-binding cassette domain-containing protein n=1 Tax=Plantactinospora alkalitolerans TaxID=2789879 RepID=A0ABS0H1I8_9ACTN|nr:ATP-binding cassette domain-containing protein [Plantactinospora alkalitolerans]MBF9132319.1 ATP-binding cassette domain-containing protein [Plantactinospora alkalitolerans]
MPELAVQSRGLSKRFGRQVAVDAVDLAVPRGSVYGFLGPNGSGKTTTIRMLLGLIRPTSGGHTLLGEPMPGRAATVLPRVGALVEGPAFHPYLSGTENLRRLDAADLTVDPATASSRIGATLDRVGLTAAAGKRYRAYSLGMRQRLALAAAMLAPRDLLILDEPTNGLDPQGTREVRTLVAALAAEGATVLLSTHLLAEVEQVCTDVGVMHQGRLVAQAPLAQLRAAATPRARVTTDRPVEAAQVLRELGLTDVDTAAREATGILGPVPPEKVVAALVHAAVPVRGFAVVAPDLEELFVSLTGEGFDVSG